MPRPSRWSGDTQPRSAAAVGGIPPQYVTVLGTVIHGHRAEVWMLTNDQPPYEPYVVLCVREAAGWWPEGGNNGFGVLQLKSSARPPRKATSTRSLAWG